MNRFIVNSLLSLLLVCNGTLGPPQVYAAAEDLEARRFNANEYSLGGSIRYLGSPLEIPAQYRVLDVDGGIGRVLVTAYYSTPADSTYFSELWMFNVERPGDPIAFDSRQVLARYELHGGERLYLCHSTVSCNQASALFVRMLDGGRTRVYDPTGTEINIVWPQQRKDLVRPIGWYDVELGKPLLACMACDEGDLEPLIYLCDPRSGKVETERMNPALAQMGEDLFIGFSNLQW